MRNPTLAFATLSLAACASTGDVLGKPPTEVFTTSSSPNEVAFCLANKNSTQALDRDDGSKVVLVKNGYGATSLTFTIIPEGTGSKVEYRRQFGTIGAVWKQCVGAE